MGKKIDVLIALGTGGPSNTNLFFFETTEIYSICEPNVCDDRGI